MAEDLPIESDPKPGEGSILNDVKKALGLGRDYTPFDAEIVMHINSTIMELEQLGVRSDRQNGYEITDSSSTWNDYLGVDANINAIQAYLYLSVQTLFDPPSISSVLTARQQLLERYAWRIMVQADHRKDVASNG